jgi:myo-inositol-1(or 4)-monophosphatase
MTELLASQLATVLHDLGDCAAARTLPHFRTSLQVDNKLSDGFDPVTMADREAERALRDLIAGRFPDHGFLGEEDGLTRGTSSLRWVVDPIDGTRAFICGVPTWTTLVGLERDGVPVAGLIDQPYLGERYLGGAKLPAVCIQHDRTRPLHVSGCEDLAAARLMVTDLRRGEYFEDDEARAVDALAGQVRLVRQGLDAYGFALLAAGQFDLVVEAALSWYDVAAAIPIIEAAGGTVLGWNGEPVREGFERGRIVAAATRALAEAACDILKA